MKERKNNYATEWENEMRKLKKSQKVEENKILN